MDGEQGCYAEYINVPQTHIIKKPEHLSWTEAASIPENFLTGTFPKANTNTNRQMISSSVMCPPWGIIVTAFQALVLIGKIQKNDHVLVHAGASGVGVAALQLARIYGA